ncbi:SDR family oxidoreductase [Actinoplanes sp. NPDC051343]|uniref:SDR family oxidoreductase n=1 Tax=Actinoplanes sp. NPDC051343 TaxID=3363906 RepID=UPI0037B90CCD
MAVGNLTGGVILGASSGVGRALAAQLADNGHQLTAISRRAPDLGQGVRSVSADIRDFTGLENALLETAETQTIEYIVNCVGVGFYAPIGSDYLDAWTDILATNVAGILVLLSVIDRHFADLKTFIHVSSMAAHRPSRTPGNLCYSVSKMAARVIVEEYRKEIRSKGRTTRISMISPGFIDGTDFGRNFYACAPDDQERYDLYGAHDNLSPADVAAAIRNVMAMPAHVELLDTVMSPNGQPA